MMQGKLFENFAKACEDYIRAFEEKHETMLEYWVELGEVACMGDRFYNFCDIRYDIDNGVKVGEIEEWDDYCVTLCELECTKKINFRSWVKGAPRPYSEEDLTKIVKLHDEVERAKKRLEDAVRKDKNFK